MAVTDWQDEARDLRRQGMSERDIAKRIGKAPSTVHDVVYDVVKDVEAGTGLPSRSTSSSNGTGGAETIVGLSGDYQKEVWVDEGGKPIPGQQTIDGQEVQVPVEEIVVTGPSQLSFFNAGGKRPATASLTLTGGKVGLVDGTAFEKGTTVRGTFEAIVVAVGQHDKRDEKTGVVLSCEQRHTARILDLTVS